MEGKEEGWDLAEARWHIRLRPLGLRRDREGTEGGEGARGRAKGKEGRVKREEKAEG